jgi:tRNA A37 threonylcarbamoyladenosine dehydratase
MPKANVLVVGLGGVGSLPPSFWLGAGGGAT